MNTTLNAASANVYGIDFDASYAPPSVAGLSLHGAVNWNRSRYDKFDTAPCGNGQTIAQGCDLLFGPNPLAPGGFSFHAQDLSGRPLVRAPEWTLNFGFDYERPVGQDLTLAIGSRTAYTSKSSMNLLDQPGFFQKDYVKTNANIALRGANDRWEVAAIGNNLTNKLTSGNCVNAPFRNSLFGGQVYGQATQGVLGDDYAQCNIDRGRELWLRLTLRMF